MWDPVGTIVAELREDTALSALVGERVRGGRPGPGDKEKPGEYRRFVVVTREGVLRARGRSPIQTVTLGIRAYGTSPKDAAAVSGAVSDALHQKGPRAGSGGGHIWLSIAGSFEADMDPVNDQPFEDGYAEVICTT